MATARQVTDEVGSWVRRQAASYRDGRDRPLAGYAAAMGVYTGFVAGLGVLGRSLGRTLPERVAASDLALCTVATHKLSRLIAKDSVTSPLRAPFTRYERSQGPAELAEQVRTDSETRHAVGEMLTCPFCIGMWAATAFSAGLVIAPRPTRLVAATLTALAGSDLLQFVYSGLEQRA
jgi:hypothetical protein